MTFFEATAVRERDLKLIDFDYWAGTGTANDGCLSTAVVPTTNLGVGERLFLAGCRLTPCCMH